MKILFVTGSLVHGGAERHAITLANRLAERGHECRAVYVKNDPSQLGRLELPGERIRCLHAQRYLDVDAVLGFRNLLVKARPTVILAANQYALMYATLARRLAGLSGKGGAPLAVTFHSTILRGAKEQLQMLAYRPMFWAADRAVFVCEAQRRHWRERYVFGRRSEVIHNGVDTEHWKPAPEAERRRLRGVLGLGPEELVIGMSAVLRPEKNHLQLVEAIAMLRRRGIRAHALMIGDGPMRGAVEARARTLGVAPAVTITGFQQEVRPFVSACDAIALTSFTEAFSLAAIEAMALARPVVHSDVGGAAEMIRPGRNGFLYPVGDTPALVDRLAALADRSTCARMGERAREVVLGQFSERAMVDRYESMLSELENQRTNHENLRRTAGAH